ncbi:MAG: proton-conducting transporter membrane subunit [Armatimonadota bacterium]
MGLLRPDTIVLNWLLALQFFAALCVELFPRLSLGAHAEREAESLRRGPFLLGALASLMGLALTIALIPQTLGGTPVSADYWWTRDLYHLRFQADVLSTPLVAVLCALGLLIHLNLAGQPLVSQPHRRAALLLVAQGCAIGCCLGADLILVCFFLQLLVLCLWLLLRLDAPAAADVMLSVTYSGAALVLASAMLIWSRVSEASTAPLPMLLLPVEPSQLGWMAVLALLGALPLLACYPANGWLLQAAEQSPAAVLAPALLLPVVGAHLLLRLLPGSMTMALLPGLGTAAFLLGALTLWWGAIRAWLTMSLRHLAAWLTVSQAGMLLLAVSAATAPTSPPEVIRAAALQLLAAPPALLAVWLGSVGIRSATGTDSIPDLGGLLRTSPVAAIALLLGGLSLAGVPPLPGFQVQRLLVGQLTNSGAWGSVAAILGADLIVAVAVLDALRRLLPQKAPAPSVRWSSPWLSVSLVLGVVALLAVALAPAALANWSRQALYWGLSSARGGVFLPR